MQQLVGASHNEPTVTTVLCGATPPLHQVLHNNALQCDMCYLEPLHPHQLQCIQLYALYQKTATVLCGASLALAPQLLQLHLSAKAEVTTVLCGATLPLHPPAPTSCSAMLHHVLHSNVELVSTAPELLQL